MFVRPYVIPVLVIGIGLGSWFFPGQPVLDSNQDEWCRDQSERDRGWYCEVREFRLAPRDLRRVDARPNGGVRVTGWDRNEVLLRAKVQAYARSDADARDLVSEVEIQTAGTVESRGPRTGRRESWSVSYQLSVPYSFDLSMQSTNGGITIEDVSGELEFETTNGGVTLDRVGGDVRGHTTNGGVRVVLSGDRWDGEGLDVRTTNGGVRISIPEGYNARLESGTTNGGMRINFPVTVSGRIDRRLRTRLGEGGSMIRAVTTNGGVTIDRSGPVPPS